MEQPIISQTVRTLTARLLEMASSEFANHSCNDMEAEAFERMGDIELAVLVQQFNEWDRVVNQSDEDRRLMEIADWEWMTFCAAVVGR